MMLFWLIVFFTHCTVSETQDIFNDLLGLLNSNGQILFTIWSDKDFHGFL